MLTYNASEARNVNEIRQVCTPRSSMRSLGTSRGQRDGASFYLQLWKTARGASAAIHEGVQRGQALKTC
jgi:hypothetical protein